VHHMRMEDVDSESTKMDIRAFVQEELYNIAQKPGPEWPDKQSLDTLLEVADKLFIWASTACRFIKGEGEGGGRSPAERMQLLISNRPQKLKRIDDLYLKVLRSAFNQDDPVVMNRFRSVMGTILAAKVPLSVIAINDLFEDDEVLHTGTESVIPHLGSLLSGTTAHDVPLQILHLSFSDFLADVSRSQAFYTKFQERNEKFAISSLGMMDRHLKRDICGVGNLLLPNSEITGIQGRINKYEALRYSCRFFVNHLADIPIQTESIVDSVFDMFLHALLWIQAGVYTKSLLDQICAYFVKKISYMIGARIRMNLLCDQVRNFLHHHVLHWIETLSLTNQIDTTAGSLARLEEWLKVL
jgi:hypothetical protein